MGKLVDLVMLGALVVGVIYVAKDPSILDNLGNLIPNIGSGSSSSSTTPSTETSKEEDEDDKDKDKDDDDEDDKDKKKKSDMVKIAYSTTTAAASMNTNFKRAQIGRLTYAYNGRSIPKFRPLQRRITYI